MVDLIVLASFVLPNRQEDIMSEKPHQVTPERIQRLTVNPVRKDGALTPPFL